MDQRVAKTATHPLSKDNDQTAAQTNALLEFEARNSAGFPYFAVRDKLAKQLFGKKSLDRKLKRQHITGTPVKTTLEIEKAALTIVQASHSLAQSALDCKCPRLLTKKGYAAMLTQYWKLHYFGRAHRYCGFIRRRFKFHRSGLHHHQRHEVSGRDGICQTPFWSLDRLSAHLRR